MQRVVRQERPDIRYYYWGYCDTRVIGIGVIIIGANIIVGLLFVGLK